MDDCGSVVALAGAYREGREEGDSDLLPVLQQCHRLDHLPGEALHTVGDHESQRSEAASDAEREVTVRDCRVEELVEGEVGVVQYEGEVDRCVDLQEGLSGRYGGTGVVEQQQLATRVELEWDAGVVVAWRHEAA